MKKILILILPFILFFSGLSQSEKISNKNNVDRLNWLSGYWTLDSDNYKIEELWLPVSNRSMIGINRTSFSSGKVFFEYLRIEQIDSTINYIANPMGKRSTTFKLKILQDKKVIFENPDHDYPQKIIYSLRTDTLVSRIEGVVDGQLKFSEWKWVRTKFTKDEKKE